MTPDAQAICAILRAAIVRTGWSETARRSGVNRVTLHRCFPHRGSGTNPSLATIAAVAGALSLQLTVSERANG